DASDDQAATAPRAVSAARQREKTARQYAANDEAGDLLDQARPAQRLQIPCAAIGALFATADAAAITLASLLGAGGYQQFISHVPWNLNFHVGAGLTAALLYGLIGRSSGFYLISDIFSVRRIGGHQSDGATAPVRIDGSGPCRVPQMRKLVVGGQQGHPGITGRGVGAGP